MTFFLKGSIRILVKKITDQLLIFTSTPSHTLSIWLLEAGVVVVSRYISIIISIKLLTPAKHEEVFVFDGGQGQGELNLKEQIEPCHRIIVLFSKVDKHSLAILVS